MFCFKVVTKKKVGMNGHGARANPSLQVTAPSALGSIGGFVSVWFQ
jgi:hypothetical protein